MLFMLLWIAARLRLSQAVPVQPPHATADRHAVCSSMRLAYGKMEQVRRQRQAAAIKGPQMMVYWTEPTGPIWLRTLLGDDYFKQVRHAEVVADLENLKSFHQLQSLVLYGSNVTDPGLENLKGLSQHVVLALAETNVTDAGLKHHKSLDTAPGIIRHRNEDTPGCRAGRHRMLDKTQILVPRRRTPSYRMRDCRALTA